MLHDSGSESPYFLGLTCGSSWYRSGTGGYVKALIILRSWVQVPPAPPNEHGQYGILDLERLQDHGAGMGQIADAVD